MKIKEAPQALADFTARWSAGQHTDAIRQARALGLEVTAADCDFAKLAAFEATHSDPFSRAHARRMDPSLYDLQSALSMLDAESPKGAA